MILLDTHVLLWMRLDRPRLGRRTREVIERAWPGGAAAVSTLTFWEVGMLLQKGRLDLDISVVRWRTDLLADGLLEIPVSGEIATRAGLIPDMHGDPADRIIAATAMALENCQLVTADQRLLDWPGQLDRLDAST